MCYSTGPAYYLAPRGETALHLSTGEKQSFSRHEAVVCGRELFFRKTFGVGAPAEGSAGPVHARAMRPTREQPHGAMDPRRLVLLPFLFFLSRISLFLSPRCHGQRIAPCRGPPRRAAVQQMWPPSTRPAWIRVHRSSPYLVGPGNTGAATSHGRTAPRGANFAGTSTSRRDGG